MRIKELRLERGLTQAEVAKEIDTSQRNIGRWENGENEPAANYIAELAKFFQVSADYLLGLEDDFGVKASITRAEIFSAEEKQLIKDYRSLNPACKKLVKQTVETLKNSSGVAGDRGEVSS